MSGAAYNISGWHFDPEEPVLRGTKGERRLEDRTARVLALLCRRRGEVVGKDELIEEVWGGRAVSANSVSIVIGSLRRALDDNLNEPVIIVTVARRGYRLAVEEEVPLDSRLMLQTPRGWTYPSPIAWPSSFVLLAARGIQRSCLT